MARMMSKGSNLSKVLVCQWTVSMPSESMLPLTGHRQEFSGISGRHFFGSDVSETNGGRGERGKVS